MTTFHLIAHTHWDREWYLPRAVFQARLVPLLDDLLLQLDRNRAARFVLDGQTVLLEDYLALRPDAVKWVVGAVRRGRAPTALELGPWYILSDLLIPSGASLRRNLEEGTRDATGFGKRLDVLYSPDAFGHPAGLPALAREFGIRFAVVRRGLGRPMGQDRDLYRWEAPTGNRESVLVYHLPPSGYDGAVHLAREGADLEREWPPVRDELVARASTDQVAVFLGADHHPPPADLAGLRDRLQALEPGHQVRLSGLDEFFKALEPAAGEVPVIRGELRRIDGHAWVLQGVHGTRARMKRRHSRAELFLSRVAEPLTALAAKQGGPDRGDLLRHAWRTLLQCQFHDTLCGTCCDEAAREQETRLAAVEALNRELAERSLHQLIGHDPDRSRDQAAPASPRLVLWNPGTGKRSGIVTAELTFFRRDVLVGPPAPGGGRPKVGPGYRPFGLQAAGGLNIPVQVLGVRRGQERLDAANHYPDQDEVDRVFVAFHAPPVRALEASLLTPRPLRQRPLDEGLEAGSGYLANRFVAVEMSRTGGITLTDRKTRGRYAGLALLEDEPDAGDTYTFSRGPGGGGGRASRGGKPGWHRVIASGPLVGAVGAGWSLPSAGRGGGHIGARLLVVLHADSPVVRLRLDLDNRATDHRLRIRFPVGAGEVAVAGAPFGVERRGPVAPEKGGRRGPRKAGAIEQPALTAPAQRFVAAGAGQRGLALFAPGFFEYEWTLNRELVVTLLRAVGQLSRGNVPERPGHAAWPLEVPEAQEPGGHTVELALRPVEAEDLERPERLEAAWEEAFLPVQGVFIRQFCLRE